MGRHTKDRDGLAISAAVVGITSTFCAGLLGGALLVGQNKPRPPVTPKPAPTVTVTELVTPTPSPTPTPTEKPKPKTPREMGKAAAAERGWTGSEWTALERLWTNESDWNPKAQNPTSTAYGIAQFLDQTWAGYGIPKTSDPERQIEAGLRYIAARYGTPSNALAFWHRQSPHWY
ncbi:hypothetical protein [Streptomyces phage phiScoe10]|nr:hypothetical protein [Streptomyces phage phiScoe10]